MTYYKKEELREKVDLNDDCDQLPDQETLDRTIENIETRNIDVTVCETGDNAREYLIDRLPADVSVMNGRSTSLHEIGFIDYLQREEDFTYLKNQIREIDDDEERQEARRQAITSDVFFDSPNAIASTGEIVGVNGKGTSIGAWPYAAKQLVLVSGTNKIVPTVDDAIDRVRNFAYPLENERVRRAQNHESVIGKLLVYEFEKLDNRTEIVLIKENLGY